MLRAAFETARSGLATEALRVQVAAQNIANASTEGYVPQQVEQSTQPGGGVSAVVRSVPNNVSGTDAGVDVVKEATTLFQAKAAYQANLAVIATVEEMTDSLFDMFDRDRDNERAQYI